MIKAKSDQQQAKPGFKAANAASFKKSIVNFKKKRFYCPICDRSRISSRDLNNPS